MGGRETCEAEGQSVRVQSAALLCQLTDTYAIQLQDTSASPPAYAAPSQPGRKPTMPQPDDLVDPREIDQFLTELAGMAGRWSLFERFLDARLRVRAPVLYPLKQIIQ